MKSLLIILLLFITVSVISAEDKVPEKVKTKMAELYPNAKELNWDIEDGNFEAEFEFNGNDMSVTFDKNADVLETETKITFDKLPAKIQKNVKKDYPDHEVSEAAKIDKKGVIYYEVELEKGEKEFDVLYSADGSLIKKEAQDNENDSENDEEDNN